MYKLLETGVENLVNGDTIPENEENYDWLEYIKWRRAGGIPEPYVAPPAESEERPMLDQILDVLIQKNIMKEIDLSPRRAQEYNNRKIQVLG